MNPTMPAAGRRKDRILRSPWLRPTLLVLLAWVSTAFTCYGDIEFYDTPPALRLSGPPPTVTIVPTHVMISNGAGEKLVDQDLTKPYKVEADPPLDKLDGKLTIETSWDNGTTTVQEFTHTPGTKVSLKQDGTGYTLTELVDKAKTEKPGGHE